MDQGRTEYTIQSVDKAFELLELLSEPTGGLSLPALSLKIGASRNKTFRLLTTLCQKGLVEKDPATGSYRLGLSSAALGQKFVNNCSLTNHAHPILEELAKRHDEAMYMTVMNDCDVLFLDMVDCHQNIKAAPFVGKKIPFFTNAAGKAMKALDSRDLLEKLLKRKDIKNIAPDLDKLEYELRDIRMKGVAVDTGGLGEGIITVAVAIKDYAGKVVGAITMLGPSFRMLTERLEREIIPSMLEEAEQLSQKFGYAPA